MLLKTLLSKNSKGNKEEEKNEKWGEKRRKRLIAVGSEGFLLRRDEKLQELTQRQQVVTLLDAGF